MGFNSGFKGSCLALWTFFGVFTPRCFGNGVCFRLQLEKGARGLYLVASL